jgi:hypothetical protein
VIIVGAVFVRFGLGGFEFQKLVDSRTVRLRSVFRDGSNQVNLTLLNKQPFGESAEELLHFNDRREHGRKTDEDWTFPIRFRATRVSPA